MSIELTVEESGLDPALLLEQVLSAVLRKYIPEGDKVKINLATAGHVTDVLLDFPDVAGQAVKISWKNVPDTQG